MKTLSTSVFLAVFFLSKLSSAQILQPLLPIPLNDHLNPAERFSAGIYFTGIFNANDTLHCAPSANSRPEFLADRTILKINSSVSNFAVNLTNQAIAITEPALELMNRNGDTITSKHHVCLGMYEDGSAIGNAAATPFGYTEIDSAFIGTLANKNYLPNQSSAIYSFYVLHEFGHHFQHWNGDTWMHSAQLGLLKNVRHIELNADCISGALHYLLFKDMPHEIFDEKLKGIVDAAEFGGDNETQDFNHHGNSKDRPIAARMGIRIASKMSLNGILPTSKDLLDACNTGISARDLSQGEDKWFKIQDDLIPIGIAPNGTSTYY